MICYQMFESRVPFEGTDPIQAAKSAAMYKTRPELPPMAPTVPHKEVREVSRELALPRSVGCVAVLRSHPAHSNRM